MLQTIPADPWPHNRPSSQIRLIGLVLECFGPDPGRKIQGATWSLPESRRFDGGVVKCYSVQERGEIIRKGFFLFVFVLFCLRRVILVIKKMPSLLLRNFIFSSIGRRLGWCVVPARCFFLSLLNMSQCHSDFPILFSIISFHTNNNKGTFPCLPWLNNDIFTLGKTRF